jgi:hypothetical protein
MGLNEVGGSRLPTTDRPGLIADMACEPSPTSTITDSLILNELSPTSWDGIGLTMTNYLFVCPLTREMVQFGNLS